MQLHIFQGRSDSIAAQVQPVAACQHRSGCCWRAQPRRHCLQQVLSQQCTYFSKRKQPAALSAPERGATVTQTESGGGGGPGGGGGKVGLGGSGGSAGDSGDDPDDNDDLLNLSQAESLAALEGVQLPSDFVTEASSGGLRKSALQGYLALQGSFLTRFLARAVPAARDRLIADHRFLFLVCAEMAIDSGCATVAEVRKRGKDFWAEFEFYLSDLLVGLVMDVVLVSLMAPVAAIGASPRRHGASRIQRALARVPSAVFEPSLPGHPRYTAPDRIACIGVKFLEYSLAGIACGIVGQGIANGIMTWKRNVYGLREDDVAIPPLGLTGLTWGLFMGVSSNLRYQAVFGAERLVDRTLAARVPRIAYLTSTILRFGNNIVGGEQFVDLARWTGVQAYHPDS